MRTPPVKPLCAPLGLGAPVASRPARCTTGAADNARMTVQIDGLRDDSSNLRVSLYREPDASQGKAGLQIAEPAGKKGKTSLVFDDIPPGRYALMAYHDANGDNKLNLRFGMFPQEGCPVQQPAGRRPAALQRQRLRFPAADGRRSTFKSPIEPWINQRSIPPQPAIRCAARQLAARPACNRLKRNSGAAARCLQALGHPLSLRILCLLADGEASVGEIQERVGRPLPTIPAPPQTGRPRRAALAHCRHLHLPPCAARRSLPSSPASASIT